MEVAKVCELKPVSFEKAKELTKGQKMLVELLIKKATANELLTRVDIVNLYLNVEPRIYYRYIRREVRPYSMNSAFAGQFYDHDIYEKEPMTIEHYDTKKKAYQWFKNNLATCIIKGKILAIPIIEDSK